MPDAIVLLRNDHKDVERLFKQYEKLGDKAFVSKRTVVDQIIEALSTHASIEEQHFYPAVRAQSLELNDFNPRATVLIESVRHHVEEEETEVFPAVRDAMGRKALQELGAALQQAKLTERVKRGLFGRK